jgi:hypothetical protein
MEKEIARLLDTSDDWSFSTYTANHASGIKLWTANGFLAFSLYEPAQQRFQLRWKFTLWRKLKQCKKRIAIKHIEKYIALPEKDSYKSGNWIN